MEGEGVILGLSFDKEEATRRDALFGEKSARINFEEVIAPTALFTIFGGTFGHHPSFHPTLGRFYEATPNRLQHTVPNLVAFLTPALPFITKLSNPSTSVFGAVGLVPPQCPLTHLWSPPLRPSAP
jgi:hypothetical protein